MLLWIRLALVKVLKSGTLSDFTEFLSFLPIINFANVTFWFRYNAIWSVCCLPCCRWSFVWVDSLYSKLWGGFLLDYVCRKLCSRELYAFPKSFRSVRFCLIKWLRSERPFLMTQMCLYYVSVTNNRSVYLLQSICFLVIKLTYISAAVANLFLWTDTGVHTAWSSVLLMWSPNPLYLVSL